MKTKSNVTASSGYLDRIVRLFRAVWQDVGMTPADAAQAFLAGVIVAIPVMAVVWATAGVLCRLTGKPLDDNAMMASVGVLFLGFFLLRAVIYLRDKWSVSSKPNDQVELPPEKGVDLRVKNNRLILTVNAVTSNLTRDLLIPLDNRDCRMKGETLPDLHQRDDNTIRCKGLQKAKATY